MAQVSLKPSQTYLQKTKTCLDLKNISLKKSIILPTSYKIQQKSSPMDMELMCTVTKQSGGKH